MSEIFDLTNDLFDAISESMIGNEYGVEDNNDDRDSISYMNMNIDVNMDTNTSIDLLEECASTLLQDMDTIHTCTTTAIMEDKDDNTWTRNENEMPRTTTKRTCSIIPVSKSTNLSNHYNKYGGLVACESVNKVEDDVTNSTYIRNEKTDDETEEGHHGGGKTFMQAAIKRRKRQRDAIKSGNGSVALGQVVKTKGIPDDDDKSGTNVTEKCKEEKAVEAEALACLESFRVDVEAFRIEWGKDDETTMHTPTNLTRYKHAKKFAQHLDSKYTSVIERLSSMVKGINTCERTGVQTEYEAKVAKIKKLVHSFCRRCRAIELHDLEGTRTNKAIDEITRLCDIISASRGRAKAKSKVLCKFKYWKCKVCGKKDLEFDQLKCSCCGRPKTYRPPQNDDNIPMFRDPIIEGEEFLAGANTAKEQKRKETKSIETIKEERIMKQFLYRKVDLELDLRTELKGDIGVLLDSIKSTKRRLQL